MATPSSAARDFSAAVRKALAVRGITIVGAQAAPAFEGDVYFSGTAYVLNDNGTHRVRTFSQVLALAAR